MPYTYEYPRPSVTVDCLVLGFDPDKLSVEILLIERGGEPFKGRWALPGGFLNVKDEGTQGESLEDCFKRELEEETGAKIAHMEQLYTFGTPGRDPRGRVISVAYLAMVRSKDHVVQGGDDAKEAKWFPLDEARKMALAFDHNEIVETLVKRLEAKVRYHPIGFGLIPEVFTIADLKRLYEALLRHKIDSSNLRKKLLKEKLLVKVGDRLRGTKKVPLYRFNWERYSQAFEYGINLNLPAPGLAKKNKEK